MIRYIFTRGNKGEKSGMKATVLKAMQDNSGIIDRVKGNGLSCMLGWKYLTKTQDEVVKDIKEYCADARRDFDDFIVLGVGGSALGAKAIFNALCPSTYNTLSKDKRGGPRFYVLDNIDPVEIDEVVSDTSI